MISVPEKPLVSVVIPAFNCGNVLAETLESVRAQTFKDFEVIIVDDGSTDDTAAVAQCFCQMDSRFTLIQQPSNRGISATRNAAIERSRGEWIAFLDGDDIWLPDKLTVQLDLSRQDPKANLLFTNFTKWDGQNAFQLGYDPDKPLAEGEVVRELIFSSLYLPSTTLVRRQTLIEVGLFDTKLRLSEDWDLWLRIAERGIWARGAREMLVRYRRWPGSQTVSCRFESLETNIRVLENHQAVITQKFPALHEDYQRSVGLMTNIYNLARGYELVKNNPDGLPDLIWRVWRRERRWKWLRWYLFLKWPAFLGGNFLRRNIHQKVLDLWAAHL